MKEFFEWTHALTLVVYCFFAFPLTSHAGDVLNSYVGYEDGHYLVQLEMEIEAEIDTVYAILTNFNDLKQLNDSIKISRLLATNGKVHQVQIVAEGCVWFFCQTVKQVQQVTELDNGYIQAVTLPEHSNMEYGRVLWHIQQEDGFTLIQYRADVVPGFFVPPLIGPYFMKARLREEAEKTIHGIERIAQFEDED